MYIDLDHIQVLESTQMHAITYYVEIGEQEETDEPQEVYNLMYFSTDYETYHVILYKYDFSQIPFQQFVSHPELTMNVLGFIPLNDIESIYENIKQSTTKAAKSTSSVSTNNYAAVYYQFINLADCAKTVVVEGQPCKGSGNPKHNYGEQCGMSGNDRATPGYSYMDFSGCGGGAPGSGGGGGGGGSVGSPGGGGGGNPGGGGSTPNNPIWSNPIKSPGNIFAIGQLVGGINQGQKQTNADWIKKMDLNPDFVTKLNELKTASTLSYESAYSMFNNASTGIQFSPKYVGDPNNAKTAGQVILETNINTYLKPLNCIGFMHCHTTGGKTYKTFSFSDIEAFCKLATLSTQNQEQLALYLTVQNGGTYVMKMTNKIKMKAFFNYITPDYIFNSFDIELDGRIDKKSDKDKQTLAFLNFINDETQLKELGLEIYEKNNAGVWEKLTLSSNKKNIVRTNIDNLH